MSAEQPTIIYTLTDEAPLLATYAFLPVVRTFADAAGISVSSSDISVAARILAEFPDYLTEEQRVPDNLEVGKLTQLPETNIIKLPNISASVPQLLAAIKELREGLQPARLPGRAEVRRGEGDQGTLLQGARQRGQSDTARRQLDRRAPRRSRRMPGSTRTAWGVVTGLAYPRRHHEARGLLPR